MKIELSLKGIRAKNYLSRIDPIISKVNRMLPEFKPDLPVLSFFIRKISQKYHIKRKHAHAVHDYAKVKPGLARFDGRVNLALPGKTLYSHFNGSTIEEGIHQGVRQLVKEIQKYKQLHFKSQSKYPNHATIRKGGV